MLKASLLKLVPAVLLSRSSGGEKVGSDRLVRDGQGLNLMSSCPHLVVVMGGVSVSCLVDTGLMVSTITKLFP